MTKRLTVAMVAAGLVLVLAQPGAADLIAHPANVRTGSCADVGDVVGPLNDVVGEGAGGPAMGSAAAIPVEASVTSPLPLTYASLFALPHSIVVDQGPGDEDRDVHVACGDIGGHQLTPTDFAIGMGGLDDSGYTGIATIHDNGDGTVGVAVYLTASQAPAIEVPGTPAP